MKKSLLALAVLGAYAGVATAQSSVTLFGVVDANGRYVKNDGSKKRLSLSQGGLNSNRLGFRGIEDLGGGLRAGFWLEADTSPDTGAAGSGSGAKFFSRRSTVSLISNAGELRLGRDYTPTFWNQTIFDAFGTVGLGSSLNVRQAYAGTRQDNSIGYFLPSNIGGFYGQVMASAAEGGTTADRAARYIGGRIGFAAGPFDVSGAYSQERFAATTTVTSAQGGGLGMSIPTGNKQRTWNVGGSWDFGFLKILGYYDHEDLDATVATGNNVTEKTGSVSIVLPLGQSEFHVGYDRSKLNRGNNLSDPTVDQIKATYQYNLSKRTAMYATVSRLDNKSNSQRITLGAVPSSATALPNFGDQSKGFELGVRHFF